MEIGCGSGFSSFIISREGYKVIGSDLSHLFLDKSYQQKGRENLQFVVSNATKLSFKNDSFDVVSSSAVIEHIEFVEEALREIIRVTKKQGIIIIAGPNLLSPFLASKRLLKRILFKRKTHSTYGTPGHLVKSIYYSLIKKYSKRTNFILRTPDFDVTEFKESDADAVYLSNQNDYENFFSFHGFKTLKLADSNKLSGKLIAKIFPRFASGIYFVARKDNL